MSSVTSSQSDINNLYENMCVENLPITIQNVFKINVLQPFDGYNRKANFENESIEIDFWAHTSTAVQTLIVHGPKPNGIEVKISDPEVIPTATQSGVRGISPEKDVGSFEEISSSKTYIIAEIVYGGWLCVKKKLKQLEKDCRYALYRASSTDILSVVTFAAVVNQRDFSVKWFTLAKTNQQLYPNMYKLQQTGRLVYIINEFTITRVVRDTWEQMASIRDDVQVLTTDVQGLTTDVQVLRTDVQELTTNINDQMASIREDINKILEILAERR